jgi:nicotinate phosphoribosyltransferase
MNNQTSSVLLTDFYQLTMLQAYFDANMHELAVFEFFIRRLPEHRNFLLVAGIEQCIHYLENLSFNEDELAYLKEDGRFSSKFIDYLATLKFTGDVHAIAEGTVVFPNEPILQVIAPISQAQLIESRIINILQYQTMIASKAARCVLAAPDKLLIDFGMRRAHGAEAALLASRANYIAGFQGTATVLAGKEFNIPTYGTMAHSFIEAHESEDAAFNHFLKSQPDNGVILIDTYNIENATKKVITLAHQLKNTGVSIKGVRIDSGDLGLHASNVRKMLDANGCHDIKIFCSGDLDEYRLQTLVQQHAPIDSFGVGTKLNTSSDSPYLDSVYKLQEYAGIPRRKISEGKKTWPGRKQVYRYYKENKMSYDVVTLHHDQNSGEGMPLLQQTIQQGKRLTPILNLRDIQTHAKNNLTALPTNLRCLEKAGIAYEVVIADILQDLARELDAKLIEHEDAKIRKIK